MSFWIYATRYDGRLFIRKDENERLLTLLGYVAKKYQSVKGKCGKRITLYDQNKGGFIKHQTIRFVARESTKYIRKIPLAAVNNGTAGRYASIRQIERLLNNNSPYTSINSIAILITILQLLLCPKEDEKCLNLVCDDVKIIDIAVELLVKDTDTDFLPIVYLGKHISTLLENDYRKKYTAATLYIVEYLQSACDRLRREIGEEAYTALINKEGIRNFEANRMEPFPG